MYMYICVALYLALFARISVKKSNNQFGELSFHGGFKQGKESLGKLGLLLLLYNALTRYNIDSAVFLQKSASKSILFIASFSVDDEWVERLLA